MALSCVICPDCQSDESVVKNGKSTAGKQGLLSRSKISQGRSFGLNQSGFGRLACVQQQIVEMTLNGSGMRDIARVLQVSTRTVIAESKKSRGAESSQGTALSTD